MCRIEFYEGAQQGLELLEVRDNWSGSSKRVVGTHKRKTQGKTYVNPRIILPNKWGMDEVLGRAYTVYKGRAKVDMHVYQNFAHQIQGIEGDCVILFFPDPKSE